MREPRPTTMQGGCSPPQLTKRNEIEREGGRGSMRSVFGQFTA